MNAATQRMAQAEKPGRLQLAIQEWQRQLVQKRELQQAVLSAGRDSADPDSTAAPGAQSAAA